MSGSEDDNITEAVDDTMMCCASCGVGEVDDIKLEKCDDCDLVRYCSNDCKEDHRSQHEAKCRERATKLRDELLFQQPESTHLGDCPICFLPLPTEYKRNAITGCCSKLICKGCTYAHFMWLSNERLAPTCPFCRCPFDKASDTNMKRIEKNDPVALREMGAKHHEEGDYESAYRCLTKAAESGDADAHCKLSYLYRDGEGVEKDETKEVHHLEEAAIAGHIEARFCLAGYEWENERFRRAVKHYIIAANLGHDESIQILRDCYKYGDVSKEDFASALRAHQAAVDATKSSQREEAVKFFRGKA